MKKLSRFTLLMSVLVFSGYSHADGNVLLKICETAKDLKELTEPVDAVGVGFCLGILEGARNTIHMMQIAQDRRIACYLEKDGIGKEESLNLVVGYLKANPKKLHMDKSVLIMLALAENYPCRD